MKLNKLQHAPILNALKQKTSKILNEDESGILVFEEKSGVYFIDQEDPVKGCEWIDNLTSNLSDKLIVSLNEELSAALKSRFGFQSLEPCWQFVWIKETAPFIKKSSAPADRLADSALAASEPSVNNEQNLEYNSESVFDSEAVSQSQPESLFRSILNSDSSESGLLTFKKGTVQDLEWIRKYYKLISKEELYKDLQAGRIWLGFDSKNRCVGFAGIHSEESMGMLFILPEYRRRGYALEIESFLIGKQLEKGIIPYAHVFESNESSVKLQKKAGMSESKNRIEWLGYFK